MALLVASLLLAALAPVITRKMDENMHITGDFNPKSSTTKKEILFGSTECPNDSEHLKTDSDGSEYCEGIYIVPADYTGVIKVTVIGAGGGGGTASTAGLTEFKEAGSATFTIPAMVNEIEATLVGGGAGGAGGGTKQKTETFVIDGTPSGNNGNITRTSTGEGIWKPSAALNNAWVKISACGGGGGGSAGYPPYGPIWADATDAGNGAYFSNKIFKLPSNASLGLNYRIGGGGSWTCADPNCSYKVSPTISNGGSSLYSYTGCYGGNGIVYAPKGHPDGVAGSTACCTEYGILKLPCINEGGTAPGGAGSGGKGGRGKEHVDKWGSGSTGGESGTLSGFGGDGGTGSHASPAGGGGGGSTWLGGTLISSASMIFQVGGGGGGVGSCPSGIFGNYTFPAGGGGGGGAGMPGYQGGNGAGAPLGLDSTLGLTITPATSGGNDFSANPFGSNYCLGGKSGPDGAAVANTIGAKNGAMRITYIDYGPGGSGGGAGAIVPIQKYLVGNLLDRRINVQIGAGGKGGGAGTTLNSGGTFAEPTIGFPCNTGDEALVKTELTDKDGNILLTTFALHYAGGWGGHPSGVITERNSGGGSTSNWQRDQAGAGGPFMLGVPLPNPPYFTQIDKNSNTAKGFVSGSGYTAGDKNEQSIGKSYADGTVGGRGGTLQTPWYTCNAGAGGTENNKDGKNGAAGGCGGGGGYSFGKGGNGGHGYARLSWNKYWDAALNSGKGGYKLANSGTGGGGATGNIMTYSIKVMGGQAVRIRIGKGGKGAEIINNNIVEAKKGGDTIFGDDAIGVISAGGGFGGGNPSVTNNSLINGLGGNISSVCHFGTRSYLNNKSYCTKGIKGFNAKPNTDEKGMAKGANGASLVNYGEGGEGGISGTSSYLGNDAKGTGSGGGGAGIHDLGDNSISSVNGTNKGGTGSNGKIIIELYND